MPIITIAEMKTHIYEGVVESVSDYDMEIMQAAIDAAHAEAQGYCSLYDVAALFAGVPNDPILKLHIKSIAKWHFMALSNPNIDYADAETRYGNAIDWLRMVQAGKVVPQGWPPRVLPEDRDTFFHASSASPKRRNHY